MDVSAEAADVVVREGLQATEAAAELAVEGITNVAALLSGFKKSAKERDAIQEIQREAVQRKFEVLLCKIGLPCSFFDGRVGIPKMSRENSAKKELRHDQVTSESKSEHIFDSCMLFLFCCGGAFVFASALFSSLIFNKRPVP